MSGRNRTPASPSRTVRFRGKENEAHPFPVFRHKSPLTRPRRLHNGAREVCVGISNGAASRTYCRPTHVSSGTTGPRPQTCTPASLAPAAESADRCFLRVVLPQQTWRMDVVQAKHSERHSYIRQPPNLQTISSTRHRGEGCGGRRLRLPAN